MLRIRMLLNLDLHQLTFTLKVKTITVKINTYLFSRVNAVEWKIRVLYILVHDRLD